MDQNEKGRDEDGTDPTTPSSAGTGRRDRGQVVPDPAQSLTATEGSIRRAGLDDAASIVEQPGATIGRYTLLEEIGTGGYGTVFLAEQREPVARKVALKIIKLGMDTRQVIARFEQERQTLALMDHPHIAKVLDAGTTDAGRPYFVMELVTGKPITQYCDERSLSVNERLEVFGQVCRAIQHAHQKGIIHRDIKPSNVLVSTIDDRPHAKVIDFGIAKATQQHAMDATMVTELGQWIGTPAYMSPEQASGSADIDTRTDVYSLGVLLYELLSGEPPFDPRSLRAVAIGEMQRVIRDVDPPRPSARVTTSPQTLSTVARLRGVEPARLRSLLRGELDWIAMKALEKDRQRRYETANGLAMDIERFLRAEPVSAAPPSTSYRVRKFVVRNKASVIAASVVLLALVGGIVGTTLGLIQAERAWRAETASRLEAQRQADIAREVNQFLTHDLLSAADPTRTQNRQITVREVVDTAARGIGHRFETAPEIGASIERAIGELYSRLGVFDAAQTHLDRAYALLRSTRGELDRDTLGVRGSLDDLLKQQGKFEEGVKTVEESVKVMRATLGPDDPLTLADQARLGAMYSALAQYDRSEPILLDAWDRQKRTLGATHRDTVGTMNELGTSYMQQQKFDKVEPILSEAFTALRGTIGEEDPDSLAVAMNLGWTYAELGDFGKAEATTARALDIARRILGNDHPQTQLGVNNLGVIYSRTGRPELALPLALEDLEVTRRTLGNDHPDLLPSLSNLAKVYITMKQYERARPLLEEAVTSARKILGKGDFRRGAILLSYGGCLMGLNRPVDAVKALLEAHDSMSPTVGPEHPGLQRLFQLLVDGYTRMGNTRAASEWRAKIIPPKPGGSTP